MLRTDMANIITAIKQIQLDFKFREATKKYQRKVKVVLIPRKTSIIEYTFEQHGVRGLVELGDNFRINLILYYFFNYFFLTLIFLRWTTNWPDPTRHWHSLTWNAASPPIHISGSRLDQSAHYRQVNRESNQPVWRVWRHSRPGRSGGDCEQFDQDNANGSKRVAPIQHQELDQSFGADWSRSGLCHAAFDATGYFKF